MEAWASGSWAAPPRQYKPPPHTWEHWLPPPLSHTSYLCTSAARPAEGGGAQRDGWLGGAMQRVGWVWPQPQHHCDWQPCPISDGLLRGALEESSKLLICFPSPERTDLHQRGQGEMHKARCREKLPDKWWSPHQGPYTRQDLGVTDTFRQDLCPLVPCRRKIL